ncbi:hypothetical protein [Vibrio phage vB_VmeM-Yong XC32]|nr:hypothetical protein [Vibrio phage vB_VmeM-Yong XC31]QAX96374.1 hypothetical protein [Vibrio phage vB_VmeM-Yong XC32]QAX96692.1 hypothetical protein [Vibrio phage vB_VmeM-Yong MS31]QAX97010.1 hypothetical protein [Vibrio phage vB_VmeM-Yong MS32]
MSNHLHINNPLGVKSESAFRAHIEQLRPDHVIVRRSEEMAELFVSDTDYIKAGAPVDLIALGRNGKGSLDLLEETDEVDVEQFHITSYLVKLRDPNKQTEAFLAVSVTNGRTVSIREESNLNHLEMSVGLPLKFRYVTSDGRPLPDVFGCIRPEDGMTASMSIRLGIQATLETKSSVFTPYFTTEFYLDSPLEAEVIGYTVAYQTVRFIKKREEEYGRNHRDYSSIVSFSFDPAKPELLEIQEDCDNHFSEDLDKKEVKELIDWLQSVHDRMVDEDK